MSCLYLIFRPVFFAIIIHIFIATLFIHYLHLHCYDFHPSSLSTLTMYFSTFLVAAIALCATSASGKCFQTGQNWGDHQQAKAQLAIACNELKGNYAPRTVAARCRNNPSGSTSFNFEIENYTGGNANISQDECERNIGAQIDNCGHGGEVTYSDVRFRYLFYSWSWYTSLLLLT